MNTTLSNLFEISFPEDNPSINVLDKKKLYTLDIKEIYQSITENSVITFSSNEHTRKLNEPNPEYLSWLFNKFIFWSTSHHNSFFDVNKFRNQFTLPENKIFQSNEFSILRRCTWRVINFNSKYLTSSHI